MSEKRDLSKSIVDLLKAGKGTKALYVIMIVGIVAIALNPIGLPLFVDSYSKTMYEIINTAGPESVVLMQEQCQIGQIPEIRPGVIVALNLLFSKKAKVVFYSLFPDGEVILPDIIKSLRTDIMATKKYGVDWVLFGYAPGAESAIAGMATNIRSVFKSDMYQNSIDEIPMMKNINSFKDISLVIAIDGDTPRSESSVRVWAATYNVKYLTICNSSVFASMQAYYPAQIKGMTNGILGGAQLEILAGMPGQGAKTSDSLTFVFMLAIATTVVVNAMYLRGYLRGERKR